MLAKASQYLSPKSVFVFILTAASILAAQELKADDLSLETQQLTTIVRQSSYSLKQDLWHLMHSSNGKSWIVVEGESFDSYKLIINARTAVDMTPACVPQAPLLVLNFTAVGEDQTQVQVDLDSQFYGQTLRQLFTTNNKLTAELKDEDIEIGKNILRYEVTSMRNMTLFGLYLRVNTNPTDDEEFGDITLSFSEHSFDFKVFDGDDDSGNSLVIMGANKHLYHDAQPQLNIFCQ